MNPSLHRGGLVIAALAVVATVAFALVLDGYASGARSATNPQPAAAATAAQSGEPSPETIYVRPAPSPSVIHVVQQAPAPAGTAPVIHVTVPGGGEPGDGLEGGGGDD